MWRSIFYRGNNGRCQSDSPSLSGSNILDYNDEARMLQSFDSYSLTGSLHFGLCFGIYRDEDESKNA